MAISCIILGAPGSGKGTQAKRLQSAFEIPHISTGDILRGEIAKASPLGLKVKEVLASGKLVDDALILQLVTARFQESDIVKGYILDGYPRNPEQADQLKAILSKRNLPYPKIIYLKVEAESLVARIVGRLSCGSCGAIFHEILNPPRKEGHCDNCGAALNKRKDDQPEVVKERLKVFERETAPLISHFQKTSKVHEVDGLQPIDLITTQFREILAA